MKISIRLLKSTLVEKTRHRDVVKSGETLKLDMKTYLKIIQLLTKDVIMVSTMATLIFQN